MIIMLYNQSTSVVSEMHVQYVYKINVRDVLYSGKFLRVQTFAKMPAEAPEDFFAVLIFATKPWIVRYQLHGLLKLSNSFNFCGGPIIRENHQKFATCKNFPLYGILHPHNCKNCQS